MERAKLTDKDLADGPARGEPQHVGPDAGVPGHEAERGLELARGPGDVHAEVLADARVDEPGAEDEVGGRDGGAHEVVGAHHLRARVGLEGAEDVVLGAVGEAVEQEVDAEEQQAPAAISAATRTALPGFTRVQREDGDAGRDGGHDQVLVQGVALAEDGDVQEHDGQQLARLGQQEGDVVDVGEAGVAEGAGERAGDGDEQQRRQDAARGDHGRDGLAARRAGVEVQGARGGREQRLDRVQEDGVLEDLGVARRAVGGCRELLLQVGPREAIRDIQN